MLESDHSALGASANRAGNVEDRTFAATPRDDECLKGLELLLALVDGVLEVPDAPFINVRLGQMVVHFVEIRRGQQRADAERSRWIGTSTSSMRGIGSTARAMPSVAFSSSTSP